VVGSLDITRALREGIKALEPGLLAEANRGILYVDEINLLDDHIVDILLDAAAMRVNIVEREGVSVSHPSEFLMIGTMNPEEGELRPQIADRIGLQVEVQALTNKVQRVEVMKRREAFQKDPAAFISQCSENQNRLRLDIERAMNLLPKVAVSQRFYEIIAQITLKTEVASHRADITILQCAKAMAALEGRTEVNASDILRAGTLALGHRMPHDPFAADPMHDSSSLVTKIEDILEEEDELPEKKKRLAHQPLI
jgi:Mg-chelatase subunit ChlI